MGQGGSKLFRVDAADKVDPRTGAGRAGAKGTLFRYIPDVGAPLVLIKMDDGLSINWTPLGGGGGGTPTGDPDTLAYFDAAGNLADNVEAKFVGLRRALTLSVIIGSGTVDASGIACLALGAASTTATIEATGTGSIAAGVSSAAGSLISAQGKGSIARGSVDSGATISATQDGAEASGSCDAGSIITAQAAGSKAFGTASGAGSLITALDAGAIARGDSAGAGEIRAENAGSQASGQVLGGGKIRASAIGAIVSGGAADSGILEATQIGGIALGLALSTGIVQSGGLAAFVHGFSNGTVGGPSNLLNATGAGAHAHGSVQNGAAINCNGIGANAGGSSDGAGGVISASGDGARAFGRTSEAQIVSTDRGSIASGNAEGAGSLISASGAGAGAHGQVLGAGSIEASAIGALAFGSGDNGHILAQGVGSIAHGAAQDAFECRATGVGSHASGRALSGSVTAEQVASFAHGEDVHVNGMFGTAFGLGHFSFSYGAFTIGRYSLPTNTYDPNNWVSTEPVFIVGNGTGIGSEANAFQIDKDGRVATTSSVVNKGQRSISADTTLDARSDFKALIDTSAGDVNITLPAGEEGLEFYLKNKSNNVVNILTTGGDILDPLLLGSLGTPGAFAHLTYELATTTWWVI